MTCFDYQAFRQQFPLLQNQLNDQPLIYFDNAATTQKPRQVLDCYQSYYQEANANVHRASHQLSARATQLFEQARVKVQKFINARAVQEIIWTKGATESINLIAHSWGLSHLQPDDEIILSHAEHHANIVPWQLVAERTGAKIKVVTLDEEGRLNLTSLKAQLSSKTRIISVAHISNVLGRINPIEEVIALAKTVGAISIIDGAQAIAHMELDVQRLDCDFYLFSAHKMFGPTGVGVLYGKQTLLENMSPYQSGGEMIKTVSFSGTSFNTLPFKFEAGTPNIAGISAFGATIDFIQGHSRPLMADYEGLLLSSLLSGLDKIRGVELISKGTPDIPVVAFTISGHHNHDIAAALDSFGIAVRSGHHCAMPLMEYLNLDGCIRVSLAPYNSQEEVEHFIEVLNKVVAGYNDANPSNSLLVNNNASDVLITLFENTKGWDQRHREIMMLGKQLKRMPKELRNEQSLITGCESLAWLSSNKNDQLEYSFTADSDAKVIRGLLVIVLAAYNHKTAEQILAFDIHHYFDRLGLIQHLSPSRGNGLLAIVDKILAIARKASI